jgi:hypothetical protein
MAFIEVPAPGELPVSVRSSRPRPPTLQEVRGSRPRRGARRGAQAVAEHPLGVAPGRASSCSLALALQAIVSWRWNGENVAADDDTAVRTTPTPAR